MNSSKIRKVTNQARTEEASMMFWLAGVFALIVMCGVAALVHGIWEFGVYALTGVIK